MSDLDIDVAIRMFVGEVRAWALAIVVFLATVVLVESLLGRRK